MLYAIIAEDKAGTLDKRLAARPAHLERLLALQSEARLILAGPCPTRAQPAFRAASSSPNSAR